MSPEHNLIGGEYPDVSVIEDPELKRIIADLQALDVSMDSRFERLTDFMFAEPALTQEKLDEGIHEVLSEEALLRLRSGSDMFWPLFQTSEEDDSEGDNTILSEALTWLTVMAHDNRRVRRLPALQRGRQTEAKELLRYWQSDDVPALSPEQAHELGEKAYRTVSLVKMERTFDNAVTGRAPAPLLEQGVNIRELKFAIINGLMKELTSDEVIMALRKAGGKSKEELAEDVDEYHKYMLAVTIIDALENHSMSYAVGVMKSIRGGHVKDRLLKLPSSNFRETYNRLSRYTKAYIMCKQVDVKLAKLEEDNSEQEAWLSNHINVEQLSFITSLVRASEQCLVSLGNRLDQAILNHGIESGEFRVVHDWASLVDKLRAAIFIKHLDHVRESGHGLSRYKELLELGAPQLNEITVEVETAFKLEQLKPEIDSRRAEFNDIDRSYQVSNKKMRERAVKDLFTDAKNIAELLPEGTIIDDETMRGLVGLMQGVYWERTGRGKTPPQLAAIYVEDVRRLRELGSELSFLGQPTSSRLLKMTSLLDELIDSGLFEDDSEESVVNEYKDFIAAYEAAKKPLSAGEYEEEHIEHPEEAGEIEEKEIPVRAIRKAIAEELLVFPPGASAAEVAYDFSKHVEEKDLPLVEWERITGLIELRDRLVNNRLEVQFIRTKHSSWHVLPFFILEVRLPGDPHAVAVVESPVYGNATYVYRESDDNLEWRDAVQLSRQEAREWGAFPTVHVDSSKLDKHFKKVWDRVISELTILR